MKKLTLLSLLLIALRFTLFSQDYKVVSVEHLPNDMTARKTILTEKINGGQQCAVLRISTQNILELQRDVFQFECDMGSVIRERRRDGGEICLWVSPGIKILKIKHNTLGNYILNIPEILQGNVQSLNTYRITITGLKEIPKETLAYGKSQMVFLPYPKDAVLYINGDSIGSGIHSITSLSGKYHWLFRHPLYHSAEGNVELTKGKIDTIFVNLNPAYGYMKILDGYSMNENEQLSVFVDGVNKGNVPYTSDKLARGLYEVTLKAGDSIMSSSQIEVKEHLISINRADELCRNYSRLHHLNSFTADSSYQAKTTRFYPIIGKVTINSIPQSMVSIDSINYGLTPATIDSLPVGPHLVELSAKSYTTLSREINIEEEMESSFLFQLKRSCVATILSDKEGDHVYVNTEYVGETPITIERPLGTYYVYIVRPGQMGKGEVITLSSDDLEPTFTFNLGQSVNIETGKKKSKIYVDGEYYGRAPLSLYIPIGQHRIRAEHGWSEGEKEVTIASDIVTDHIDIETHRLDPTSFLSNGAFFMTGNIGLFKQGKPIFGFNIGDIAKRGNVGWYFNIMTNGAFVRQIIDRDFDVLNAYRFADEDGNISGGNQPTYTGEQSLIRASALFGVALKVSGPVYLKIGAGYGIRRDAWKADNNSWVIIDPFSWNDFEASLGLQCCIYNIVVNADALIPVREMFAYKKKAVEFRIGLGFCLKHKK